MSINNLLLFFTTKALPLSLSIIGFGLLVVVHELGHFLFCKLFGIHTPTFSIGFGPKIIEKKIGNTNFQLAAIPFGGYVEIAGLEEIAQGDQAFAKDKSQSAFSTKAYWQKMLVLLGGILCNFLFAYVTFCLLFIIGDPKCPKYITVSSVVTNSAGEKFGLNVGDEIIGINAITLVSTPHKTKLADAQKKLLNEIYEHPNQEITLHIKRDGNSLSLPITLGTKDVGGKTIGVLGASFQPFIEKLPFIDAIKTGINETNTWIYTIAQSMRSIFTRKSLDSAGGPVMIIAQGFKTAQSGLIPLLLFLALMSINLALFNLLPLGITDGGQIFFTTIEFIIRRPVPDIMRTAMNIFSLCLFILLATYLTYKDIVALFGSTLAKLYSLIVSAF